MTDDEWGGDRPSEQEVQEFLDGIDGKVDALPPPAVDFDSHPTEMYALFLQQATGAWTLNRFCYDRGNAEVSGINNRNDRPWRVVTYRAVPDA